MAEHGKMIELSKRFEEENGNLVGLGDEEEDHMR